MDFLAQLLREVLMVVPGAFVRWNWLGRKRKFFEFVNEDKSIYNYVLSILIIIVVVFAILLVKRI